MALTVTDLADPAVPDPAGRRVTRGRGKGKPSTPAYLYILIVLLIAVFGAPFLWIILTALASPQQLGQGAGALLALNPQLNNFVQALTRINFGAYAANSLILALLSSVLGTASSATVGFAFARLRAKGQRPLFTVVVGTMMIPSIATLIPTYVLFSRIGLVNTYWPWVLWGLAGVPYLIFLFRQFFSQIPLEIEDAAIIDGAGWWRMYVAVFLPLSRPVILTSLLLSFTWAWGDYLAPSLLLSLDNTTLAVATTVGYLDPHGNGLLTVQAAAALLYIVPVVVIFLFFQKYFVASALGSGVKG